MRQDGGAHRFVKRVPHISGINQADGAAPDERFAVIGLIDFIFERTGRLAGERHQRRAHPSFRAHEFFARQAKFPFMRLPTDPRPLPAPRLLARLTVIPAHIPAIETLRPVDFLRRSPQKSVRRRQHHLRIGRKQRQETRLRRAHRRPKAERTELAFHRRH